MDGDLGTLVGQELVGFRLTARLGEGGMAAVFFGESVLNPSIKRAIKVVRPEFAGREEFRSRFADEASILESLRHRNIVSFYGVRSERGYLVMELELLEGKTLAQIIQDSLHAPQNIQDAVGWIHQASEGVAAAHERRIVHRDLKPENLFLTAAGTIKVMPRPGTSDEPPRDTGVPRRVAQRFAGSLRSLVARRLP